MRTTATRWEDIPAVSRAYASIAGFATDLGTPAVGTSVSLECAGVKHIQAMTVPTARQPSESSP